MNTREKVLKNVKQIGPVIEQPTNYRFIKIEIDNGQDIRFINIRPEQVDLANMFTGRHVDIVVNEVYHKNNGKEQILHWDLTHIKVHEPN